MKYIKLNIGILFILVLLSITSLCTISANSDNGVINIHYFRYDSDYTGWNIWLWPDGSSGMDVEFESYSEDGKFKVATIDLDDNANEAYIGSDRLGIIIKKTWDLKDISSDRYFNVSFDSNNECNIYLAQGEYNIGYSEDDPNGPDTSHKFLSANFNIDETITFTTTNIIDKYEVYADETKQNIHSEIKVDNEITFNLNDSVDLKKKYLIKAVFDDVEKSVEVGFSALYDTNKFKDMFEYDGELGVVYSKDKTIFRVWSPLADSITVRLYNQGSSSYDKLGNSNIENNPYKEVTLESKDKGLFETTVQGDLSSKYYTYFVTRGIHENEIVDPYAYSTGVNGTRGMIVDFNSTNPTGWEYNDRPETVESYVDNILYELHVRDLTSHSSWNGKEENRGKFLGLVEEGTTYDGYTTGIDHIKELGITTVHLLPSQDFGFVDETKVNDKDYFTKEDGGFNWGYMTENYNTLEGSYSTNPYDGSVRINEFKEMIQGFHNNDIRVVMDVVYNHTSKSEDSNFNILAPGYYHRFNEGSFSNGSGCGNETASERGMMSKFIVDSVLFYANEYNISGFRFDLMKLHDIDTMNKVSEELHKIDPSIIVYGEPWDAGGSSLDSDIAAGKENIDKLNNIAIFNDDIRDSIKGSVFLSTAGGYVQGDSSDTTITTIKNSILGNGAPNSMVNYVSAHDNNTLNDKLKLTGLKDKQLEYAHKQANAIVLLSQGVPFLHAGVELSRSKPNTNLEESLYSHNSYNQPDSVNQIRWDLKKNNIEMFNYYKSIIEIRKTHPAFRMTNLEDINNNIEFLSTDDSVIAFIIKNNANNDTWDNIIVAFNNSTTSKNIDIPDGEWTIVADKLGIDFNGLFTTSNTLTLSSNDTVVMYNGITQASTSNETVPVIIYSILIVVTICVVVITSRSVISSYKNKK